MLIAVWVLYKKGYFGAMVLLEIGFIACGVEAYFPAAYNLKAFVFGLAFYQLMGLFKGKEKKRNEERQSMHQNNRIIHGLYHFIFNMHGYIYKL